MPNETQLIELPPRQLCEDLESVQNMAARAGNDLGIQAEIIASAEWLMDQHRAAAMRHALALSADQHAGLLERFRRRNQEVWGIHSRTDL